MIQLKVIEVVKSLTVMNDPVFIMSRYYTSQGTPNPIHVDPGV